MTSLQQQLAAVAANSDRQLDLQSQRSAHGQSLVWEPSVAVSQTFESIYQHCIIGFRELAARDLSLAAFEEQLFSPSSIVFDRLQSTDEENRSLNRLLKELLPLLSPYIHTSSGILSFEWLVRRFRVHEYNIEDLVYSFLSCHSDAIFVKLLVILPSKLPKVLKFLQPYKNSLTYPPFKAILYAATNDSAVFSAFGRYWISTGQKSYAVQSNVSQFWLSIMMQATLRIVTASQAGNTNIRESKVESAMLQIVPVVREALDLSHRPDMVVGSFNILVILASGIRLPEAVLDNFMTAVATNWTDATTQDRLICLATICKSRETNKVPKFVAEQILSAQSAAETLEFVSETLDIKSLVYGLALRLSKMFLSSKTSKELALLCKIFEINVLDKKEIRRVIKPLIKTLNALLRPEKSLSSLNLVLRDGILQVLSSICQSGYRSTVRKLAQKEEVDLDILDSLLVAKLPPEEESSRMEIEPCKEKMADINTTLEETKLDNTILDLEPSSLCEAALRSFNNQQLSSNEVRKSLRSRAFKRSKIAKGDTTFITFCLRLAFTNHIPTVRLVAIGEIEEAIIEARQSNPNLDFQVLLPYVICLLGDSAPAIRKLSVRLLSKGVAFHKENASGTPEMWAGQSFYPSVSEPYGLSHANADSLTKDLLKNADAVAMDAGAVLQTLKQFWEKMTKEYEPVRDFFIRHAVSTGILSVKATLVGLLPSRSKNKKRRKSDAENSKLLYLAIKDWLKIEQKVFQEQGIDYQQFLRASLEGLKCVDGPVEPLLQELFNGDLSEKALNVVLDFIRVNWRKFGDESRSALVLDLINHTLSPDDLPTAASNRNQRDIASSIRSLPLRHSEMITLLQHVIETFQGAEEYEPKRRRMSHETVKKSTIRDVGEVIRRVSFILEVVESVQLEAHSDYVAKLFEILGRLQALAERTESSFDYVKLLCVRNILGVVEKMTDIHKERWHGDGSLIRSDLLVDIVRETQDRELQNNSLLVISNVAPWVPELTLNSVMPIFTFMGDTILRDEDDYTAHIVNQTISTVVPSLTKSLKKRGRDIVSGTADILISFTAAFEHIPQSRRENLFRSLVDALGSGEEDFLFAVVVLLLDKHSTEDVTDEFIPTMLQQYDERVALKALIDIMNLFLDMLRPNRTRSNALLNLNELSAEHIYEKSMHLMDAFNRVLSASQVLMRRIGQSFSMTSSDFQDQRREFQNLMKLSIQLCRQHQNKAGMQLASALQRQIFLLLDTEELVEIGTSLSADPDKHVRNSIIDAITKRCKSYGTRASIRRQTVTRIVEFVHTACQVISNSDDYESLSIAIACVYQITRGFGAKDHGTILDAAKVITNCISNPEVQRIALQTLSAMFAILKTEALPVLPLAVNSTFDLLSKAIRSESPDVQIHDACLTLLNSVTNHITLFMSGKTLQRAVQLVLASIAAGIDSKDNLTDRFCQSVAQFVGPTDLLLVVEQWYTTSSPAERTFSSTMASIQLIIASIQNHKEDIADCSMAIFRFIFEALQLRAQQAEAEEGLEETEVQALEQKVIDLLLVAVTRVNNRVLHPFFAKLVEQASNAQNIPLVITTCKAMLSVQEKLKSLFTSYMSLALTMIGGLLERNWDLSSRNEATLFTAVLSLLTQSFVYDESNYWQSPSNFSTVAGPLVQLLALPSIGKIDEKHCIEAIAALAKSAPSQDHYKTISGELFKLLRGESSAGRASAVRCERYLTSNLGEEWLALLPEMLPVIAELLEDDDDTVGRETRAWVRVVEEETGESMDSMLQ